MAFLRVYGHENCPEFAATRDFLLRVSAPESTPGAPDPDVIDRAARHGRTARLVNAELAGVDAASCTPAEVARILSERPEAFRGPVTVRGNRYVAGADPARLQSLMY